MLPAGGRHASCPLAMKFVGISEKKFGSSARSSTVKGAV
jgi:hypothetical protein